MTISRAAYRALLRIELLTRDTAKILAGRTSDDLQSSVALQQVIERQVSDLVSAARRVRDDNATLLEPYQRDLARLGHSPCDWDTLQATIPRINRGVATILSEVSQPRWTPLGLRHRRRRQRGRDESTR